MIVIIYNKYFDRIIIIIIVLNILIVYIAFRHLIHAGKRIGYRINDFFYVNYLDKTHA